MYLSLVDSALGVQESHPYRRWDLYKLHINISIDKVFFIRSYFRYSVDVVLHPGFPKTLDQTSQVKLGNLSPQIRLQR